MNVGIWADMNVAKQQQFHIKKINKSERKQSIVKLIVLMTTIL